MICLLIKGWNYLVWVSIYLNSNEIGFAAASKSLQSCPTVCDPIDGSPPGSPVPWILQARTLEWVAISFSNTWKWKVKMKSLSRVRLFATPWTVAYQAPPSMGFSRQEHWSGVPLPSPSHGHNAPAGHQITHQGQIPYRRSPLNLCLSPPKKTPACRPMEPGLVSLLLCSRSSLPQHTFLPLGLTHGSVHSLYVHSISS